MKTGTATIVLVGVLITAVLVAFLTFARGQSKSPKPEEFTPSKFDDRLAALDREAIETAYKTQIEHLFAVWMKDETGQPARAVSGARSARRAFIGAMTEIEKRERR